MIFVNHVVVLIIDRCDVPRDIATTICSREKGVETGAILLHVVVHIQFTPARLHVWLREIHANAHIAAVALVHLVIRLGIFGVLVLVIVNLLLRHMHRHVAGRPHLECRGRGHMLWLRRMHGKGTLRGGRRARICRGWIRASGVDG